MTNKTTKREFFTMLLEIDAVSANSELVSFINHEIELLDSKSRKSASKRASANTELEESLFWELDEIGKSVTVSDFMKLSATVKAGDLSNQKVTAIFAKLKKAGRVTREEVKGKAYFSV